MNSVFSLGEVWESNNPLTPFFFFFCNYGLCNKWKRFILSNNPNWELKLLLATTAELIPVACKDCHQFWPIPSITFHVSLAKGSCQNESYITDVTNKLQMSDTYTAYGRRDRKVTANRFAVNAVAQYMNNYWGLLQAQWHRFGCRQSSISRWVKL